MMKNPQRHHNHYHRPEGVAFEECLRCATDKRICEKKIRFATWAEADEWVHEFNVDHGWQPPLMTRYPCRWCDGWHMKTVRGKHERVRAERQRRKWIIQVVEEDEEMFRQWVRTGLVQKPGAEAEPVTAFGD